MIHLVGVTVPILIVLLVVLAIHRGSRQRRQEKQFDAQSRRAGSTKHRRYPFEPRF